MPAVSHPQHHRHQQNGLAKATSNWKGLLGPADLLGAPIASEGDLWQSSDASDQRLTLPAIRLVRHRCQGDRCAAVMTTAEMTSPTWLQLRRVVRFGDTDAAGVMHFHQLLRWCHEAWEESLEAHGLAAEAVFPGCRRDQERSA